MRRLFLLALLFSCKFTLSGQGLNPPVYHPDHRHVLQELEASSINLAGKNLNRFAIDRLVRYDQSMDSLYKLEKADSLKIIEQIYLSSTAAKQHQRKVSKEQIRILQAEKDVLADEYHGLLRKAALAFLVWTTIIIVMIQFRKRKVKASEISTGTSEVQLQALEGRIQLSAQTIEGAKALEESALKTVESIKQLKALAAEHGADPSWPNEVAAGLEKTGMAAERELRIIRFLRSTEDSSDEKVNTDINQLCDTCMEIAQRGIASAYPELNCQVSRDFEKKLPEIKVIPHAVGNLLLDVLLNAFQSVQEKQSRNIKGYQPKIAISTRILPRFLQIRVRDNGTGMSDEVLTKAMEEFFTTKSPEMAVGLGLSESVKVISSQHKGEIKIESEKENSCDVYIKFFI